MLFTKENAGVIISQLGGSGRLKAMIGAKNFAFSGEENFVSFRWTIKSKNKANFLKIKLNSMDTYDLEFASVRAGKYNIKGNFNGIYADQLIEIFENETGLYLTL